MKKLLEREPTPEMLSVLTAGAPMGVVEAYQAMWDAAPALPDPGEVESELRDIDYLFTINNEELSININLFHFFNLFLWIFLLFIFHLFKTIFVTVASRTRFLKPLGDSTWLI